MSLREKYGKVAVIMGGDSSEREVSLISGAQALEALLSLGVDAHKFDPVEEPMEKLVVEGFSRALLMLHGGTGENGVVQAVLEYLKIPYTGSGVEASAISMDKYRTKLLWQHFGIPVAKSQLVLKNDYIKNKFKLEIKLPFVVKPAFGGSTIGLSKVFDLDKINAAINLAFEYDKAILIEEFIDGAEYTATVCGDKVYPFVKIEAPQGEYDYTNKYFTDDTKYLCPYDLGAIQAEIEKYALLGYNAVGASGVTRIDFMLDKDNKPYFLEINTLPGMTPHSLVPMAFKACGIDFKELCLQILDGASIGH